MRSRTSFCNRADLRVDFTRFAPLWALYTVLLFVLIFLSLPQSVCAYDRANVLLGMAGAMAPIQFGYALITAQCLFGYLFDTRLCCGLHAMPQTRLCRFRTHVFSGLVFALVPDLLAAGACRLLAPDTAEVVLWWLAAAAGQYLFFFSLAVLGVLCAGNRVGGVLVYGIVNFLPLLALWMTGSVFQPLLYGVTIPTESFSLVCPLLQLTRSDYLNLTYTNVESIPYLILDGIAPNPERLRYLAVCSLLAPVLLALAALLYRRRQLESAGELLAVKALRPVFLLIFTLTCGAFFQFFALFFGNGVGYGFLLVGLPVGYYTGRMLLERQVNVFRLRTVPAVLGICGVLFALLLLTGADVFGIIRSLPAESDIASVSVIPYAHSYGMGVTSDDPADIWNVLTLHRSEIRNWKQWRQENRSVPGFLMESYTKDLWDAPDNTMLLTLRYGLKNGKTVDRVYQVDFRTPEGQIAMDFVARPENILGVREKDQLGRMPVTLVEVYGDLGLAVGTYSTVDDTLGLLEAIYDDCQAGRFLPDFCFDDSRYVCSLSIGMTDSNNSIWISVYDSCTETVRYLKNHVVPIPEDGVKP